MEDVEGRAACGVLTEVQLRAEIEAGDLVITPLLNPKQVEAGSVNLRLGTRFIKTLQEQYGLIDPSALTLEEARKFLTRRSLVLGHSFVLHPRQLVLAGTFEFISLPTHLCGYVLSRSSYGRIGLIVATATFVHPDWKGCLTLELFNYGDAPIKLECGEPIAQLILHRATPPYKAPKQSCIPTGPRFPVLEGEVARTRLAQRQWPSAGGSP